MRARGIVAALTILVGSVALAQTPGGPGPATGPPPGVSLTGHWQRNPELSDDPNEVARRALEGVGTGASGPEGDTPSGPGIDVMTPRDPRVGGTPRGPVGGLPGPPVPRSGEGVRLGGPDAQETLLRAIDPPDELTIAQRPSLILIQEGDDEDDVRGLHPDGQPRRLPDGGQVKASWEDGQLVVETRLAGGFWQSETFELSPDGAQLTVTLHVSAPGSPSQALESVYERSRDD